MAQTDSPLQQVQRLSQHARALGLYNEATIILDDYFSREDDSEACTGITARIEFTLNYLGQGYLRRAHDTLLHGLANQAVGLVRDARDPELALFNLLVATVQFRYGTPANNSTHDCEMECDRVWKEHLEMLESGGHTETHVMVLSCYTRRKLIMMY
jgi:hypothetical protein